MTTTRNTSSLPSRTLTRAERKLDTLTANLLAFRPERLGDTYAEAGEPYRAWADIVTTTAEYIAATYGPRCAADFCEGCFRPQGVGDWGYEGPQYDPDHC